MATQKTIVCREGGADCDYEVRDSDEAEVLASARAHAKRKHAMDVASEQLRPLLREVKQPASA
jgi:predicted small metal-binding protein